MVTLEKHVSRQKMSVYLGEDSSTPLELAQEMISKIPLEILKDSERRFLDPCAGTGTFLIALFHELKKYHKEDHILSSMLHACEVDKFKLRILKNLGIKNIYEESFLEKEFDMEFDVVLGNPPYQQQHSAKRWTLWSLFVDKAKALSKEYVVFVTPSSWLGPGKDHSKVVNNLVYANLDARKYFNVGSTFSYYVLSANPTTSFTFEIDGKPFTNLTSPGFFPVDFRFLSINQKVFAGERTLFKRTTEHHTTSKLEWESQEGGYEVFHTNAQTLYTSKLPKKYNYEDVHVMVSLSGYPTFRIQKNLIASQAVAWLKIEPEETESARLFFESKLVTALLKVNKWSGWNSLDVIKSLPKVPYTISWTDKKVYQYFKLTQEEIDLIESTVG